MSAEREEPEAMDPGELPSPAWHREILRERLRLAAEGKLKFHDWDTSVAELRDELRGSPDT